ncbi:hypothetical protein C8Q73DRAFT_690867 [Cubamyces lactineus]|nr:hypothetical protein C8Q73DRAFT_690867 [Cubamyces lactineus]
MLLSGSRTFTRRPPPPPTARVPLSSSLTSQLVSSQAGHSLLGLTTAAYISLSTHRYSAQVNAVRHPCVSDVRGPSLSPQSHGRESHHLQGSLWSMAKYQRADRVSCVQTLVHQQATLQEPGTLPSSNDPPSACRVAHKSPVGKTRKGRANWLRTVHGALLVDEVPWVRLDWKDDHVNSSSSETRTPQSSSEPFVRSALSPMGE